MMDSHNKGNQFLITSRKQNHKKLWRYYLIVASLTGCPRHICSTIKHFCGAPGKIESWFCSVAIASDLILLASARQSSRFISSATPEGFLKLLVEAKNKSGGLGGFKCTKGPSTPVVMMMMMKMIFKGNGPDMITTLFCVLVTISFCFYQKFSK